MAFFDAYVNLDTPRKLRMLRRNLKWASESDLLILRQPSLFSSFFSSFSGKNFSGPKSGSSASPNEEEERAVALSSDLRPDGGRSYSDGSQQIVIRHIHEFKMPLSSGPASTEDSGCCRTSPSSCEGCDVGTLDSGISLCGTLDSGLYDCINPMIPSIIEDCSSHHFSDIILPESATQAPTSLTSNYSYSSSGSSSLLQQQNHHHAHCCPGRLSHSRNNNKRSPSRRRGESVSPARLPRSHGHSRTAHLPTSYTLGSDGNKQQSSSGGVFSHCSPPARCPITRNPLPPDSPTPHNSPRIPTRVSATRNRTSRALVSQSQSSYSSTSESEPAPPPTMRHALQRSQSQPAKTRLTLAQKIRSATGSNISSSNESLRSLKRSPTPDSDAKLRATEYSKNANNTKESLCYSLKNTNLTKCQASISADHIPIRKDEEIKVSQSISGLEISPKPRAVSFTGAFSKPVSVVRGVASAIRHSAPKDTSSLSFPNLGSGTLTSTTANSQLPIKYETDANMAKVNETENVVAVDKFSKQRNEANTKEKYCSSSNRSSTASEFSSEVDSSHLSARGKPLTPPLPSRGSFDLETHFGMHDISDDGEPVTVLRPASGGSFRSSSTSCVTFKEAINGSRRHSQGLPSPHHTATESPSAKATPFKRSSSMRVGRATSTPKVGSDVALLKADTLFTNFVVSPKKSSSPTATVPSSGQYQHYPLLKHAPAHCPPKKACLLLPYNIDSDSDEDVLEHRLVAGAYGAPLVSSESYTSVSHDDNNEDTDPSATEYNTDNGSDAYDFTPHLFRLNYDELQDDKHALALQQEYPRHAAAHVQLQQQALYHHSSPGKIHRRNSLSRIQEEDIASTGHTTRVHHTSTSVTPYTKLKKQDKFPLNHSSLSGVKKKKKMRTAKMVAAETFNAMFTFCTP